VTTPVGRARIQAVTFHQGHCREVIRRESKLSAQINDSILDRLAILRLDITSFHCPVQRSL
jgi:hypothetical protein